MPGDDFYVNAISMVKDEADLIEATVSHMCEQCSFVLVADNGSTDGTAEILREMNNRIPNLSVTTDDDPAYYQSQKVTALAHQMMNHACWLIAFDADEIWTARGGLIREVLRDLPPEAHVCEADVFDHVAHPGEAFSSWRRTTPLPLGKVACRAIEGLTIHQGNHSASFPGVRHPLRISGVLEVHHFPYRSHEQFIRKVRNGAAAYAATTLDFSIGQHWREYGQLTDDELRAHFDRHFFSEDPEADGLIYDPVPVG